MTEPTGAPIETWPADQEMYRSLKERFAALVDEQVVKEQCACGEFEFVGPLVKAREAFRTHVELVHPERLAALEAKRIPRKIAPSTSREPDYVALNRLAQIAGVAA